MKKRLLLLFILFAASVYAGAIIIDGLHVNNGSNGSIIIRWTTGQEINVSEFILQRKTSQTDWMDIKSFTPQGSNSTYQFTDDAAYKTSDVVFYYRLGIKDNDGTITFIEPSSINQRLSGVKQTWGSIKAMFR